MKKFFSIIVLALVGTHLPESLAHQSLSKFNLDLAKIAVDGARRSSYLSGKLEAKLQMYRQWHHDLKTARNGREFNSALDNVERDLDLNAQQIAVVLGRSAPITLKSEIQKARVEVQRGQLDLARQRVERAVGVANQVGLNI